MNAVKKSVFHKTYGNGIITEHNGDVITVDFSGVEKKFLLPDSFEQAFLSTNDEELSVLIEKLISEKLYKKNQKINIKKSNPILFCNISWMDSYLGETDEDIPQNGGSYVAKNKSPLLIGLGDGYNMVCSDAMAMIRETSEFMEIHDKELVVLTKDSVSVMDYDGNAVERDSYTAELDL